MTGACFVTFTPAAPLFAGDGEDEDEDDFDDDDDFEDDDEENEDDEEEPETWQVRDRNPLARP